MIETTNGTNPPVPAMRLLRTKLYIPRAHPAIIQRPWLIAKLNAGLQCGLTLLSAPAGSGKTTLLSVWVAQSDTRVAWVSLDEHDNDPARFWTYVITALQTADTGTDIGKTALAMLQISQPPRIEVILTELLNDVALAAGDIVLVMDDYHLIQSTPIHAGVTFLIENLPAQLHVYIATRTDPPLPLPLMRARRQLIEVNNLRFNAQETGLFLKQVMGLSLVANDVTALETVTEGWIAGLQLAALALQSDLPVQEPGDEWIHERIRSFTGQHRFIFDYLAQEVFERQPEDIRRFLLLTAILDRLNGELCDAVTGQTNGHATLESLVASRLFIAPLDQRREWYRYHPLLAQFLRSRLDKAAPLSPPVLVLHSRASQWYLSHGFTGDAVAHALKTDDFAAIAQLLVNASNEMFQRSELSTMLGWLDSLPPERVHSDPQLSLLYAWVLLATSHMDLVNSHLQDAEKSLGVIAEAVAENMALPATIRGTLAEVLCVRSNLAFHAMEPARARLLSEQALLYLTNDVQTSSLHTRQTLRSVAGFNIALALEFAGDIPAASERFRDTAAQAQADRNLPIYQLAISHMAQMLATQGQLRSAMTLFQQAIQAIDQGRVPQTPLAGVAYAGIGHILREWNEVEGAVVSLQQGLELGRQWDNMEALLSAYTGMACVRDNQGNSKAALALLLEAGELARRSQVRWGDSLVMAQQAEFLTRHAESFPTETRGQDSPSNWAPALDLGGSAAIAYNQEAEAILYVRILLNAGRVEEGLRLAARIQAGATSGGRWSRVIEMLVLQAVGWHQSGETDLALTALTQALGMAEPEGFVRIFIDEGEPVAELLRQLRPGDVRQGSYIARLLAAHEQDHKHSSALSDTSIEPTPADSLLSERELQVLRLMVEGRTNQEIAAILIVSPNTVKTHLKNIFGRLDVRNRTEAAARARERGLL